MEVLDKDIFKKCIVLWCYVQYDTRFDGDENVPWPKGKNLVCSRYTISSKRRKRGFDFHTPFLYVGLTTPCSGHLENSLGEKGGVMWHFVFYISRMLKLCICQITTDAIEGRTKIVFILSIYWWEMQKPRPGFELRLPCPFSSTITIALQAPQYNWSSVNNSYDKRSKKLLETFNLTSDESWTNDKKETFIKDSKQSI